ncbi:hypothetical protein [Streptomyces nigrescens]|uniref:Uncharacterized protein n=1 Tax=Streptomyces nigrescens TaxID=1920 RepID=A0A640TAQ7_STRNI|nr:hypothetical protein [Streptomyces libani]WAT94943.1 hypothetical protein STRLI_000615 [Streptomyces libani subsp. libani]GFE20092.1 hypothetical protein Sliba_05450 [Streptomyces libani subsp. libani]GGV85840.1 hypothetical protein GCM10010500_02980 [Streptomyces libani subsp. libani]
MFVLSYAKPGSHRIYPNDGTPHGTAERAALEIVRVLGDAGHGGRAALEFARLAHSRLGDDVAHAPSGFTFRVAPAEERQ